LNQNQSSEDNSKAKKVRTQVKCPHCGKQLEAEVEIPEAVETPKVTWIT